MLMHTIGKAVCVVVATVLILCVVTMPITYSYLLRNAPEWLLRTRSEYRHYVDPETNRIETEWVQVPSREHSEALFGTCFMSAVTCGVLATGCLVIVSKSR